MILHSFPLSKDQRLVEKEGKEKVFFLVVCLSPVEGRLLFEGREGMSISFHEGLGVWLVLVFFKGREGKRNLDS